MSKFIEIDPYTCDDNFFKAIDRDWMLLTAKHRDTNAVNCMTASWGGVGIIWHQPVAMCVIRPQRYTMEFTENSDIITFQFFDENYRQALTFCGRNSGRDVDKLQECGFTVTEDADIPGGVYFNEAKTVIIGRKLYYQDLKEENFLDPAIVEKCYPLKDFHRMYICRIEKMLVRE